MANKKVSGKTHTQKQLDAWANLHNPNNKAYRANANNHSNQQNPNKKTHKQVHNARRRLGYSPNWDWAPDYPEFND